MRWGLIGTRGLAVKGCLRAFAEAENAELAAVLSSDAERAREFGAEHGLATATADLGEFVTADIDAVWVASPTFRHYEQARAALEAGKHALVEKPLAYTAEQAHELVALARDRGLLLATGYQARYVPAHKTMKHLIDEGAIGRITAARTYYGLKRPGPPPEWRQKRDTARWGALADVGTHHIDLLGMLVGEIQEASGYFTRQQGFETEDAGAAAFLLENDVVATLTISTNAWAEHTRVEIHGTEGALVSLDTNPRGEGSTALVRRDAEPEDITGEQPFAWTAELEAVSRAAAGEDVPYATGEDGARNVEIMAQLIP